MSGRAKRFLGVVGLGRLKSAHNLGEVEGICANGVEDEILQLVDDA